MAQKLQFTVDMAERLDSVADASVDVVFSVGALEHMLDKGRVVANVFRVLKPGGRFICLTPNGQYLWYRWLASLCGLETRHLSTDWYLSRGQLDHLLYRRASKISRSATGRSFPAGICIPCMPHCSTSWIAAEGSPLLTSCAVGWWYARRGITYAVDGDYGPSRRRGDLGRRHYLQACRARG